jgi:hypothetical protein
VGLSVSPCVELSQKGKTSILPLDLGLPAREYKLSADSFSVNPESHKLALDVPGHFSIEWGLDGRMDMSENSGYSRYIQTPVRLLSPLVSRLFMLMTKLGNFTPTLHLRQGAKREIEIQSNQASRPAAATLNSFLNQISGPTTQDTSHSRENRSTPSGVLSEAQRKQASLYQTQDTLKEDRIKAKQDELSQAMSRVSGLTEETDFRQVMTGLGLAESMIRNGDMNLPAGKSSPVNTGRETDTFQTSLMRAI